MGQAGTRPSAPWHRQGHRGTGRGHHGTGIQGMPWDRRGMPRVAGEPALATGSIWSPDGTGRRRSVLWSGQPPWRPILCTVPPHLCHGRGHPPCPQSKPPAPPCAHHALPVHPVPAGRMTVSPRGRLMSHPVMPFPAACSGRFPPRGAWHVLASPPQVSGANQAAGAPPQGWGLGSTAAGCGTERVLTVTPVGIDLAMLGHPCAPLAWAPMETAPFPQPAGGWVPTLPQRHSSPCQPPSPPAGCQAGGPQSCVTGSLAPPGCQGAGHSPPPHPSRSPKRAAPRITRVPRMGRDPGDTHGDVASSLWGWEVGGQGDLQALGIPAGNGSWPLEPCPALPGSRRAPSRY